MIGEVISRAIDAVGSETESWCRKAVERGAGWRVWRSEPRQERGPNLEYLIVHNFQLLPPDSPPPGSGVVFGPWDFGER